MAQGKYGPCISRHSVMIHDRGGVRRLAQLTNVQEVKWGRALSRTSTATVVISYRACLAQLDVIRSIRSKRHELVLFRGDSRPWEGPIEQVAWFTDRVEITARDVSEYVQGTPLSKDWPNADGGGPNLMTDRIEEILTWELTVPYTMDTNGGPVEVDRWENVDPPANVLPYLQVFPSTTLLTRSNTSAFEMSALEHLLDLARSGLDFTVNGRSLMIWDSGEEIGRTRRLTEADFYGEPRVYDAGSEFAAIAHIAAQEEGTDEDAPPAIGSAGAVDPYYGPWTRIVTSAFEEGTDAPTQSELNSQAQRTLYGRNPVPLEILVPGQSGIRLSQSLALEHLVPGTNVPIETVMNLRKVNQVERLDEVTVHETPDGENVSVNLIPTGVAGP